VRYESEVIEMLYDEWDLNTALAVEHAEGLEEGMERGMERGKIETARNALVEGLSIPVIQRLTGLDTRTIQALSTSCTLANVK
jgi:hypothetical protein